MLSIQSAVFFAATASLITTSVAYPDGAYGFGGYANDFGRVGPYDANSEEWFQAVNASNSTGLFNIPGYDVSQPWPGTAMDGWTLSVAALDVSGDYSFEYERMIGYSLTLKAPDASIVPSTDGSLTVDVDPSWGLCYWNWESPGYSNKSLYNNPDNKPLATDGSCSGLLSDACIAALEKQATTNYYIDQDETWGPYNSSLVCQAFDTPSECGERVGNAFLPIISSSGLPIQYLNGSVTDSDGWELDQNNTQQDIEDMWDSMVVNFWPVMTLFVHMTNNSSVESPEPGFAKIHCISPDGVGTDKVFAYSDIDTNSTSSVNSTNSTNSTSAGGSKSMVGTVSAPWWASVLAGISIPILAQMWLL